MEKSDALGDKVPTNEPLRISQRRSTYRICGEDHAREFSDSAFWSRMPTWTIDEAVALAFGKNPEVVSYHALPPSENLLREKFRQIRKLAFRAVAAGMLSNPCPPVEFIDWTTINGIPFSSEIAVAVSTQVEESTSRKNKIERDRSLASLPAIEAANTRSLNTVLKMVGGLVVAIYKYDPDAKKSDVPRLIQSDLDLIGVKLDLDTIRKWAKAGVRAAEIEDL